MIIRKHLEIGTPTRVMLDGSGSNFPHIIIYAQEQILMRVWVHIFHVKEEKKFSQITRWIEVTLLTKSFIPITLFIYYYVGMLIIWWLIRADVDPERALPQKG